MIERYIAVDNVCAWPCLTKLPDGGLLATIFNQPCHCGCEGDTECWASDDDGRMWERRGMAAPRKPGTAPGLNHAAGLARDGAVVVITTGRDNRPPPGQVRPARESQVLPPIVCRSTDNGHTWTQAETVAAIARYGRAPVAFGPIVQLDDGTLGAVLHYGTDVYLYRSTDDGRTWDDPCLIGADIYNETAIAVVGPGALLAAARGGDDQHIDLFASSDNGRTWTGRGPVTMAGQIPGNLLKLADGRVLLTYGVRNPGWRGLGYRLSKDDGLTWSRPGMLLDFGMITDGGYPSCVQLDDGTIITAYYAGATPAHMRYHMGIMRWQTADLEEPSPFANSFAGGAAWRDKRQSSIATNPGKI